MQYDPYERQSHDTATIDTERHSPARVPIETPARQRLARQGRVLKHDVQKLGTLAKDAASESPARKVRANPWKSIALAACAGTLLGAFLRR